MINKAIWILLSVWLGLLQTFGQANAPVPVTTPYSRDLLRATNATDAATRLGLPTLTDTLTNNQPAAVALTNPASVFGGVINNIVYTNAGPSATYVTNPLGQVTAIILTNAPGSGGGGNTNAYTTNTTVGADQRVATIKVGAATNSDIAAISTNSLNSNVSNNIANVAGATMSGAGLTTLSASQLSSGIVPDARISTTWQIKTNATGTGGTFNTPTNNNGLFNNSTFGGTSTGDTTNGTQSFHLNSAGPTSRTLTAGGVLDTNNGAGWTENFETNTYTAPNYFSQISYPTLGVILSYPTWTTFANTLTNGFAPTISGGVLTFPTNTTSAVTNYLAFTNKVTLDPSWSMSATVKYNGGVGGGVGLGMRYVGGTTVDGMMAFLQSSNRMTITNLDGTLTGLFPYQPGLYPTNVVFTNLNVASGDTVSLTLEQLNNVMFFSVIDLTKNTSASLSTYDPLEATLGHSQITTRGSKPALGEWILDGVNTNGTMTISNLLIQSYFPSNSPLVFIGDSKTAEYYGMNPENCFPNIVANALGIPLANYSGSGLSTSDFLKAFPYILAAHPRNVILCGLGRNDTLYSIPQSTTAANLTNIVWQFNTNGTKILVGTGIPEVDQLQTNLNTFIVTNFPTSYVDLQQGFDTNYMLITDDHIHPNAIGNLIVADDIYGAIMLQLGLYSNPTKTSPDYDFGYVRIENGLLERSGSAANHVYMYAGTANVSEIHFGYLGDGGNEGMDVGMNWSTGGNMSDLATGDIYVNQRDVNHYLRLGAGNGISGIDVGAKSNIVNLVTYLVQGAGSYATDTVTFATSGITNTLTKNLRVVQFTGTSVVFTNIVSHTGISLGTITTTENFTLQPNEALIGTGCAEYTNVAW